MGKSKTLKFERIIPEEQKDRLLYLELQNGGFLSPCFQKLTLSKDNWKSQHLDITINDSDGNQASISILPDMAILLAMNMLSHAMDMCGKDYMEFMKG